MRLKLKLATIVTNNVKRFAASDLVYTVYLDLSVEYLG